MTKIEIDRSLPDPRPIDEVCDLTSAREALEVDPDAVQELRRLYVGFAETEEFRQLGFETRIDDRALDDFVNPYHEAATGPEAERGFNDFLDALALTIITPQSQQEFSQGWVAYWEEHGLEQRLKEGSICVLTNHRFFTDLLIASATLHDARQEDPDAARRINQVYGRLMSTQQVDIGDGQGSQPVTQRLKVVGRQIHTVQQLPGMSDDAIAMRRRLNDVTKECQDSLFSHPGNIVIETGSGGMDLVTPDGSELLIGPVNKELARLIFDRGQGPGITVCGLFISGNAFRNGRMTPADARFGFVEPRQPHTEQDVADVFHEMAEVATTHLQDEFDAVRYPESREELVTRMGWHQ